MKVQHLAGKASISDRMIAESRRMHLVHCSGCSDAVHRDAPPRPLVTRETPAVGETYSCPPMHDPRDSGFCLKIDCENYGMAVHGYDC